MNLRRTLLRWTFRRGRLPWWAGQLLDFDPEWVRVLNRLTRGRDVDRAHFWSVYNLLPMEMQPIALSWFDRHVGLQEGEIFYFQETTQRMWLHSDPAAWGLDCSQVWTWLEKACPHRFESCYLLAGYEYATLTEELKHQILSIQATYVGRPESLFMGHLKEKKPHARSGGCGCRQNTRSLLPLGFVVCDGVSHEFQGVRRRLAP